MVNALSSNNLIEYYEFENDIGTEGNFNLTSTGETSSTGIIGNSYNVSRSSGHEITFGILDTELEDSYTINTWINLNPSTPSAGMIDIIYALNTTSTGLRYQDGFYLQADAWWDGINENEHAKDTTFDHGTHNSKWVMLTLVRNTTNHPVRLYVNGTLTGTAVTNPTENKSGVVFSTKNAGNDARSYYGSIDETSFWNKSLTPTEITELYNGGAGLARSEFTVTVNNFSVTLKNLWNDSSLQAFNVTMRNGVTTYNVGPGGFTLITPVLENSSSLWNITYHKTGYLDRTFLNVNISTTHTGNISQSIITPVCYEKITNNSLICVNTTIYPNEGYQNFTISVNDYFDVTQYENITLLDNKTINFGNFASSNISLESKFLIGAGNSNCNYTATGITYPTFSETSISTNTNSSMLLINGTYSVQAICENYATSTKNITVTAASHSLTFDMFTKNSINMTFIDANTNNVLNTTTITIQIIGATSQTNTTINGTLYIDLLNPSDYTLIFDAYGYRQGSYIFTLVEGSTQAYTFYMELTNQTSLALITVKDKYSKDPIRNSHVTIQKYFNNAWITDQIIQTDFNGQTEAHFVVSTAFYNFLVEVDETTYFGSINSNEDKKSIYSEDITNGILIEIDTNPNTIIPNYQSTYDIITSIKFVNTSNTTGYFSFTYDDTNNNAHNGLLTVIKDSVIVCSNTASTESANIICNVNVTAGDGEKFFTATGSVDGVSLESSIARLGVDPTTNIAWGGTGFLIGLFITIIGFFVFLAVPSISIMIGSGVFAFLMFANIFMGRTDVAVITAFLFAAYMLARIPSKEGVNG